MLSHVRRLGWGVIDQAASSVTNFAVVFYAAHTESAAQFGAFSLAYVTYSFVLNASRGLSSDPLLVRFSGADISTWRRAVNRSTGTATFVGLVAGSGLFVTAAVIRGNVGLAFLALGLTMPGLLLQDSWRFSFFTLERGKQAFLNDVVWASALLPALVVLRIAHLDNVFCLIFAWGLSAMVAAVAGLVQARIVPRLSSATEWLSRHRDLGYRYLAENTTNSGATQLRTSCLGIIVGLAAVGYVQAANTLMGPVMVVFMGMGMIGIPEASRMLRRSVHHLQRYCLLVSAGLVLVGCAWGTVLVVALPRGLGSVLLGPIWRPTYPLMIPFALSVVGTCSWSGPIAGLHALGAARRSLRAMVTSSMVGLAGGLIGALTAGVLGSVQGLAIAAWLGALMWWRQLRIALRETGQLPSDGPVTLAPRPGGEQPAAAQHSERRTRGVIKLTSDAALACINSIACNSCCRGPERQPTISRINRRL